MDGCRNFEVQPRLLLDGVGDDQQHPVERVAKASHVDGKGLPERPTPVESGSPHRTYWWHHLRARDAARIAVLAMAMDDMDRNSLDLGASHLHHFDNSSWMSKTNYTSLLCLIRCDFINYSSFYHGRYCSTNRA